MSSDDLRKRLEAMNGGPLKTPMSERPETPRVEAVNVSSPVVPAVFARRSRSKPPQNFPFVSLEERIAGVETISPNGKPFYLVEKPLVEIDEEAEMLLEGFNRLFPPHSAKVGRHCCVPHATAQRTLFLDLETSGLGSSPIFLVGILILENDRLLIRQYFARNFEEEANIISMIAHQMRNTHLLVTYNGRTFDEPYLRSRAMALGIQWHEADGHLDLLTVSRRAYKGVLPNCKLQTLERFLCGRTREDDIPGSEIPEAYRSFIRTQNAYQIGRILEHNLWDMVTMVALINRLFGN